MNRWLIYGGLLLIVLPAGVKLSLPVLAEQVQHLGWFVPANAPYTVESLTRNGWIVRAPDQSLLKMHLAGIVIDDLTQREALSTVNLLLEHSESHVNLWFSGKDGKELRAIALLPNGTTVQQVLLSDGLAKLDSAQSSTIPPQHLAAWQQAQTSAQQQHKGVWGQGKP